MSTEVLIKDQSRVVINDIDQLMTVPSVDAFGTYNPIT